MKGGPQGYSMGRVHEGVHGPDVHVLYTCPLQSIALNYRERTGPAPPKAMLRAIRQPKERGDIVITKLDKGSDVVVMDKTDYVHFFDTENVSERWYHFGTPRGASTFLRFQRSPELFSLVKNLSENNCV